VKRSASTSLSEMKELEGTLNYTFMDKSLLLNSLVHKSFANENQNFKGINNEKIELLGDSVIGLIIIDYLYDRFIRLSEGDLVKIKSAVVSEAMLSKFAISINLGKYLYLSKGEWLNGGCERPSTLSDAFEALIGAIYLDGGLDVARKIFLPMVIPEIDKINNNEDVTDFKTILQEYSQSKYKEVPKYILEDTYGPDHDKSFIVSIEINDLKIGSAEGKSKKEAEQHAAKSACYYLKVPIEDLF
jgi:ribonuclease-3